MHVILRIRVPLLRVKSQYTLTGKVGKEMLHGDGLLAGNFSKKILAFCKMLLRLRLKTQRRKLYVSIVSTADVVGDFTLELKKINDELMIVRGARAKLSAKDKKINLQGMNEQGPVQAILSHGKYEQFKHRCDLRQDA